MQRINDLLSRITELSDDELTELRDLVAAELGEITDDESAVIASADTADQLGIIASAVVALEDETARRKELREKLANARTGLANLIPADRKPNRTATSAQVLTAAGVEIPDGELAQAFISEARALPMTPGAKLRVAQVRTTSNAPRLHSRDSARAVSEAFENGTQALVAAGGFATPVENDYAILSFETAERPVKAALPQFVVDRGGIRFVKPAELVDYQGAVGVWDAETDVAALDPAGPTKNIMRVVPEAEVEVQVQAVTNRLIVGNLMMRAYPEFVEHVVNLTVANHARLAEQELLAQVAALSTAVTVPAGELGATRTLLNVLEAAVVQQRSARRMPDNAMFTAILPSWLRAMLRADLAAQRPGDNALNISDGDLASYLSTRGIVPVFSPDHQVLPTQVAGAPVALPATVDALVYPTGTFQFLDGGVLDLGLVRSPETNERNDAEMFSETFEAVAFRGGQSLRLTVPLTANGVTRAEVAAPAV